MKDVYYLIDSNGYVESKFEPTRVYGASIEGVVFIATSWNMDPSDDGDVEYEFLAAVYCKFDSCTHWWFKGEDYDAELKTEEDSYYHLCGEFSFANHIRAMCFVWKMAPEIMKTAEPNNDWTSEYMGNKTTNELIDLMLKDYTIKHVTEEE